MKLLDMDTEDFKLHIIGELLKFKTTNPTVGQTSEFMYDDNNYTIQYEGDNATVIRDVPKEDSNAINIASSDNTMMNKDSNIKLQISPAGTYFVFVNNTKIYSITVDDYYTITFTRVAQQDQSGGYRSTKRSHKKRVYTNKQNKTRRTRRCRKSRSTRKH
jgi:hypothetical protein